jgi:hypothetical protein
MALKRVGRCLRNGGENARREKEEREECATFWREVLLNGEDRRSREERAMREKGESWHLSVFPTLPSSNGTATAFIVDACSTRSASATPKPHLRVLARTHKPSPAQPG